MSWTLTPVEEAVEKAASRITMKPRVMRVGLIEALGKWCAERVKASKPIPPYDRSAVDGYAVHHQDVIGASPSSPVRLKVLATLDAGDVPGVEVVDGCCVEVATGAMLPRGADAVVMKEYTVREGNEVEVLKSAAPWENVSRAGEDLAPGTTILEEGARIRPWHVAALASQEVGEVKVYDLQARIVVTGDEVRRGLIPDYTGPLLEAWLREKGFTSVERIQVGDDEDEIAEAVSSAIEQGKIVFTTGGTSVGRKDYTVKAASRIGDIVVHGVALKPGRTMAVAVAQGIPIFMLSGLPVAALVQLEAIAWPTLCRALGLKPEPRPIVRAVLTRRVRVEPGLRGYVRVKVYREEGMLYAEPLRITGSGVISSVLRGNGFLVVPEELEGYDEGEEVEVELYAPVEQR